MMNRGVMERQMFARGGAVQRFQAGGPAMPAMPMPGVPDQAQLEQMPMEQVMDEANWPQQFDMEHFKSLRSFKARMDYCKSKLSYIGGGTGRIVF
jgi:hypothetical protein